MNQQKRISETEYKGVVSWPEHSGDMTGDGYFSSTDAVREHCISDGIAVPETVYGCTSHQFTLDADGILESEAEQDHYHEAILDAVPVAAKDALRKFIADWNDREDMKSALSYLEDVSVVVVMDLQPEANQ